LDGFVKKINEIGNDKSKIHETFDNEVQILDSKKINYDFTYYSNYLLKDLLPNV